MRRIVFIFVVAYLTSWCLSAIGEGKYTCQADVFTLEAFDKKPIVWSPDHSKHVQLFSTPFDDANLSVYSGKALLTTITLGDASAGTFIKWAPDSNAFYVMWSDGGSIGEYHVRAFVVVDEQATESPAPKIVAAEFAKRHYCEARGNNLFAIRWEAGSKQLLLEPEVYPTGDCGKDLGFASGYLVDTESGEIRQRYTAKQIKELAKKCPSVVFPGAFTTQEAVDSALKRSKVQK